MARIPGAWLNLEEFRGMLFRLAMVAALLTLGYILFSGLLW